MPVKRLMGAPVLMQPKAKVARRPQWWIGALTLLAIVFVASLVALCIQAGMTATVSLEPRTLYGMFLGLGLVGMTAGGLVENNGHLPTFHPLYHTGQTVCTIVNTLFYSLLFLVWLMYHSDERLKK